MMGAANAQLAPEALKYFVGKSALTFPHADEAGRRAARS